jgi:hypothetical protein
VFKLPGLVVQSVPLYSSVAPVSGGVPPNANAAVCVPQPAKKYLAVLTGFTLVQEFPSYSSVLATSVTLSVPAIAKPAVCVPAPADKNLAVFKGFTDVVQVEPSYSSVAAKGVGSPPKAKCCCLSSSSC